MGLVKGTLNLAIRAITAALCRLDVAQLERVPFAGPLIVVFNHINFLEAPVLLSRARGRPLAGFAKVESWDSPLLRFVLEMWGFIPLHRGEADVEAFRLGLDALRQEKILLVAPEGTRSHDGLLLPGRPGVVVLALRSGAPIQPLVYYGNENFHENLRHLRRTDFHMAVGDPFYLDARGERVTQPVRRRMVDEAMYQMAALLPPAYRGVYADLDAATEHYLRFPEGAASNLPRAR